MSDISSVLSSSNNYGNIVWSDSTDNSIMDPSSFLNLMVAELTNQDFMDPYDTGEMISTMATYTEMQIMQEMGDKTDALYAINLVGQTVTASRFSVTGDLDTTTGVVEKVTLYEGDYYIYVNGVTYTMDQIMSVSDSSASSIHPELLDLTVSYLTSSDVELSWSVPTEDSTVAEELKYTIYYSTEEDMNTVNDVKENGTVSGVSNQSNITTHQIVGLEAGTTYYVNVLVTTSDGSEHIYKSSSFTTLIGS